MKDTLFIIPARAGSKGLPGKNTKLLNGKSLIEYSIDYARCFVEDKDICITTNDPDVLAIANSINLKVPFTRPEELSNDTASANDVIRHCIDFFLSNNIHYKKIVYLQPTSPFRLKDHLILMNEIFDNSSCEMVVSVFESHLNPYFSLFEENGNGFLKRSKELNFTVNRRQDVPKVYAYNGSIYIINVESLFNKKLHELTEVKKFEMPKKYSIDIDNIDDWMYAEFLIEKKLI